MKTKPSAIPFVPPIFSSIAMLFLILLMSLFAAPALADRRDFVIENNTPWTIRRVQLRASWSHIWDGDSLQGDELLRAGYSVKIYFSNRDTSQCTYDVMVTFHQNTSIQPEWSNVNLCETNRIQVWYNSETEKYMLRRS